MTEFRACRDNSLTSLPPPLPWKQLPSYQTLALLILAGRWTRQAAHSTRRAHPNQISPARHLAVAPAGSAVADPWPCHPPCSAFCSLPDLGMLTQLEDPLHQTKQQPHQDKTSQRGIPAEISPCPGGDTMVGRKSRPSPVLSQGFIGRLGISTSAPRAQLGGKRAQPIPWRKDGSYRRTFWVLCG